MQIVRQGSSQLAARLNKCGILNSLSYPTLKPGVCAADRYCYQG